MQFNTAVPTPVKGVDPATVLDADFAANKNEYMTAMGAKNIAPPLARSSHLKNIKTGLIFPWNLGMAKQFDLMVNCDASGNTDPAAWQTTVNPEEYSEEEHDAAIRAAYAQISHNADTGRFQQGEPLAPQEPQGFPEGVQTLESLRLSAESTAAVSSLESALE